MLQWLELVLKGLVSKETPQWVIELGAYVTLLSFLLTALGIIGGLVRLIWIGIRRLEAWWRDQHAYQPGEEFPFEVLTVQELEQRLLDEKMLTTADNAFVSREWEDLHSPRDEAELLLILAPAESGKTREALEHVKMITRFSVDVTVLWPKALQIPLPLKPDTCPRLGEHTVLFWDSLENAYPPSTTVRGMHCAEEIAMDPSQRLCQIIAELGTRCSRFSFVATVRSEKGAERLPGLNPADPDEPWNGFRIITLPHFAQAERRAFIQGLSHIFGLRVSRKAMKGFMRYEGASPESFVVFLREKRAAGATRIEADDLKVFEEKAYNHWHTHTYLPLVRQSPSTDLIYMVLKYLRLDLSTETPEGLVLGLASSFPSGRSTAKSRSTVRSAYRILNEKQLIALRDGQIIVPDFQLERAEKLDMQVVLSFVSRWRPTKGDCLAALAVARSIVSSGSGERELRRLLHRCKRVAGGDASLCLPIGVEALGLDDRLARAAFEVCVQEDPESANFWTGLGLARLGNNPTAAIKAFTVAIGLPGASEHAWGGLGHALCLQGKFPEAEVAQLRAVELAPEGGIWREHLGMTRVFLGRHEDAAQDFLAARQLKPDLASRIVEFLRPRGLAEDPRYQDLMVGDAVTATHLEAAGL